MTADRPIIVVGCPRSGTTLLQLMLHSHPRIAVPPENRFVLPAYERRRQFGDLGTEAQRRAFAQWLVADQKKNKLRDFDLDEQQLTARIAAAGPTLGSALAAVFEAYAARFGKPRWGDKRPAYATHLDVVRRLYPHAQIVSIVRDGRDCVASLSEMPWYRHDTYYAAATWALSVDATRHAARRLGPDTMHEMSYERLVTDPEPELRQLCTFLGEEYHPDMAAPAGAAAEALPDRKQHHARAHEPPATDRVESWRERLTPWQVSLCEAVLGDRLRRYGYTLSHAPSPGAGARLRFGYVLARRRLRTAARQLEHQLDRARRIPALAAPPAGRPDNAR